MPVSVVRTPPKMKSHGNAPRLASGKNIPTLLASVSTEL